MSTTEQILRASNTIAVVGLSDNPSRDSYEVARYLQRQGYRIIPVNPNVAEVLGEKSYPDVLSVPEKLDVVNIFRRSEEVSPIVDQAIVKKASTVWMQLGIVNEEAAQTARENGLDIIMNRCMSVEHRAMIRDSSK
jgi:predicted CoA-binding protein